MWCVHHVIVIILWAGSAKVGIVSPSTQGQPPYLHIKQVERGDVIGIPKGVVFWWYNDGDEQHRVLCVEDTNLGVDQQDGVQVNQFVIWLISYTFMCIIIYIVILTLTFSKNANARTSTLVWLVVTTRLLLIQATKVIIQKKIMDLDPFCMALVVMCWHQFGVSRKAS